MYKTLWIHYLYRTRSDLVSQISRDEELRVMPSEIEHVTSLLSPVARSPTLSCKMYTYSLYLSKQK